VKIAHLQDYVNFQNERFGRSVVMSSDTAVLFLYSFKPGQAMTDHTHPFSAEFLTVVAGEALITINTETVLAQVDDVVIVPPEAVHSIQNQGREPLLVTSFMSPKP
jgi:quercetin dioxygenase-like cupin family protein